MLLVEIAIVAGLILLNGFFAMSELAVVSSRPARLSVLAAQGRRGAVLAEKLLDDPTGFLSTVQVGISLVAVLAGAYSGTVFAEPLGDVLRELPLLDESADNIAFVTVVLVITYLSLIVGELVPKRIALGNAEAIASAVAPAMQLLARLGAPVVWFLRVSTEAVLRLLRVKPQAQGTVTEEEVRTLIKEGTKAGVFAPAEREMIEGVIRIADRSVRSIMVPRPDVVWLDLEDPPESVLDEVRSTSHSRYPVCRGEVDDIVGVAHTRDMLEQMRRSGTMDLTTILREPLFIAENMPVLALLDRFRSASLHLAVIVDEHGTFEGIVTPMDILGGIAGDLPQDSSTSVPNAVRREDGSWLLEGSMPVHEVEEALLVTGLEAEDYETLAGFMLHHITHLPQVGESCVWNGWRFEVVDLDGRRIDKVMARREPASASEGE